MLLGSMFLFILLTHVIPEILTEKSEMIGDLIIAAHSNARSSIKEKTKEEISKATGGLGIPGFKWPF